jgi:hypothetical protein
MSTARGNLEDRMNLCVSVFDRKVRVIRHQVDGLVRIHVLEFVQLLRWLGSTRRQQQQQDSSNQQHPTHYFKSFGAHHDF